MDSFKQQLDEIRKLIERDPHRRRVLLLCQQAEPRAFDEYSSSGSFRQMEKFQSSTYSEVLKAVNLADNNKPVVMKIMRALSRHVIRKLPSAATRNCQSYSDVLNELVVTQALSQLHQGVLHQGALYRTHFFCLVHEIKIVNGNLDAFLAPQPAQGLSQLHGSSGGGASSHRKADAAPEAEAKLLSEEERMLMEALPLEYVVSVMRHDGQPLWWMMSNKKLEAAQLMSVLLQVIVGIAVAEKVYQYEHRDLHVSNILIKPAELASIPFVLEGRQYGVDSHGVKATIIDATFSRLSHSGRIYFRDLTSTLCEYGAAGTPRQMSLQNRAYRQMVRITDNEWDRFAPKTNLVWLTYLCETMMKNRTMRAQATLFAELEKIRDYTLKVANTFDLLGYFPFERHHSPSQAAPLPPHTAQTPQQAHQPQQPQPQQPQQPQQQQPQEPKAEPAGQPDATELHKGG